MNKEYYSVQYIDGPIDGSVYTGPELMEGTMRFNEQWPTGSYYQYIGGVLVWHPPTESTWS